MWDLFHKQEMLFALSNNFEMRVQVCDPLVLCWSSLRIAQILKLIFDDNSEVNLVPCMDFGKTRTCMNVIIDFDEVIIQGEMFTQVFPA